MPAGRLEMVDHMADNSQDPVVMEVWLDADSKLF